MSANSKKHCIIFDMDGTLVDSSLGITNSVNYARKFLGLMPVDKELILTHINTPGENLARRFYNIESYTPQIKEVFMKHYLEECVKELYLYEGIKEALEFLEKRAYLAIATNAHDMFAKKMMRYLDMEDYFSMIVGANTLNSSKPNPLMIEYITKQLKVERQNALLVGDSQKDELAAQGAGIEFMFADWGFGDYTSKESTVCEESSNLFEKITTLYPDLKD